jgi:flagellar basal body-associated protein FliL
MGSNHLKIPPTSGLELDKIEILTHASPDIVRKPTSDTEWKSAFSAKTASPAKKHLRLMVAAVITTLALLVIMAVYMRKLNLAVSFLSSESTAVSENHLRIGPISATMNNNELIRLSVDIECKNDVIKKRLAEKDSRIRDKIVSVITAPGTETLFKNHQYDAVRAKIKESLGKIDGESVSEVYFAELLIY